MSVGYFSAHSARETQLLGYLVKLTDKFAWDNTAKMTLEQLK